MTGVLWVAPASALLLGYLLGSIPFGLLLTRFTGAGDLRQIGSGSIGATNVLRTGRKGLAAATLLLDLAKGAAAVLLARWISPELGALGAAAAVIGHCYPVWLKFDGGKGIATAFGVLLALAWPVAAIAAGAWIAVAVLTRYSSAASLSATVAAPVAAAWLGQIEMTVLLIGLAMIIIWKHRANIGRLMAGTESRIGQKG